MILQKTDTIPLVISFSGGRTSAYMTKLLLKEYSGKRDIHVVFANTGRERRETLQFIHECDVNLGFNTVWLEAFQHHGKRKTSGYKVITFETASTDGSPFEDAIKKHGIPNKPFPMCTRELKTNPIKSYLRDKGIKKYDLALGIRIDEPKRLTPKPHVIYPLAHTWPTTKLQINQFWHNQSFNLVLKDYEGNCDLCWKKSNRKLMTLLIEHPEFSEWWNRMEIKYGNYIPVSQQAKRVTPITFFRGNTSMQELIEDSKLPFTLQNDAFTLEQLMFSDPEMDFEEAGCGKASCEPF